MQSLNTDQGSSDTDISQYVKKITIKPKSQSLNTDQGSSDPTMKPVALFRDLMSQSLNTDQGSSDYVVDL